MNRLQTFRLLSGYFLYECGRAMYFVLITWFLFQWTNDALYTGLFVSFGFLPGLFSNLVFGVIVDRYNRKLLAIIAGGTSILFLIVLFGAFLLNWIYPWVMIGTHMILQTAGSLFRPSLQALVAEVFRKEALPRIFSLSGSSTIGGSLVGAGIGGLLSGWLAVETSLMVVIGLYAGAWISISLLSYEPQPRTAASTSSSFWKELKEGFVYLKNHRMLYGLFVMMMLGQLTFHTTLGFLSVYTSGYLQQSSTIYGLLDATFSVGGITAGLLGTWWWMKCKNHLAIWSLLTMALGLFVMGVTNQTLLAFIGVVCVGVGTSLVRALLQSVQQMATEKEFHGRMSSFRMLCNQASVVITGPIFGYFAASYGANYVFLFMLVPVLLGIVWAFLQSRNPLFIEITKQKTA
ncbi:MFS transporter [Halobacillus sp. BBL2006]|uniref:MFS transporter n=1 Tax=Halobacillus sp. BBL2006 TaxID=1543706 RepID=UPI000543CD15|nr:MFS transporter [Halobacillus sp. BBL2006]KHE72368.1 MFS transporter [Halobacillus sp. BBL2006]